MNNPRAYIDYNGGYQSHREGLDKIAHDEWMESTTWNLSRDDFIRLSYFHGCLDRGSDGFPSEEWPINGSGNRQSDVVYKNGNSYLTRSDVTYWLNDYSSYIRGFKDAWRLIE